MRISGINQATNFGRIVKIHTSAPNLNKNKEEKAITELVKVLNNEESKKYQVPMVHNQIKRFFQAVGPVCGCQLRRLCHRRFCVQPGI